MTERYTYAEFVAAGVEPRPCDGTAYRYEDGVEYWFACNYHEGYIDGFMGSVP